MKAFLALLFVAAPLLLLAGCASQQITGGDVSSPYFNLGELKEGDLVHLPTGRSFTEDELIDYLSRFRVIYIGEAHDSVQDHKIELTILRRLARRYPGKVALGMEMLRLPYQDTADKWIAGDLSEKEFVKKWMETWGQYEYYRDILLFARDSKIPLVALNREKPKRGMVTVAPAGEAPKPEGMPAAPKAEVELDENDPYYADYIGAFFRGHEGGPEMEKMFLRGQMLWDETMADSAAKFLVTNPDKKLIVIAGGNHVRFGFGIPRRVFRRVPEPFAIVDPWIVSYPEEKKDRLMDVSPPQMPLRMADFIWGVAYEDLEDKTVKLGVMIEPSEEPKGVKIVGVMENSPANKAGIQKDDVIVGIDGAEIQEIFDVTFEVSQKKIGQAGEVKVLREGKEITVPVTFDRVEHPKTEKK